MQNLSIHLSTTVDSFPNIISLHCQNKRTTCAFTIFYTIPFYPNCLSHSNVCMSFTSQVVFFCCWSMRFTRNKKLILCYFTFFQWNVVTLVHLRVLLSAKPECVQISSLLVDNKCCIKSPKQLLPTWYFPFHVVTNSYNN